MATGKDDRPTFRVRARLLRMLGEELISDEAIAVIELVKNSYDAGARNVTIRLRGMERAGGRVEIEDDGHGMNPEEVRSVWLELGTPSKRGRDKPPKRRPFLGRKGVGRFAADKIASRLVLRTKRSGAGETVGTFDWGDFEDDTRYLDDIHVRMETRPSVAEGHGTCLVLEPTRAPWPAAVVEKIRNELVRLFSPFKTGGDFAIHLEVDGSPQEIGEINRHILKRATARLEASCDGEGRLSVRINGKRRSEIIPDRGAAGRSGPFTATIYMWRRDPKSLEPLMDAMDFSLAEARAMLDKWCGISIYRDGGRVYPYGQPGNDWLDLDRRRINVPGYRLSNNLLIGAIHISSRDNPDLVDQTNREGLIENGAYADLRTAAARIVQELANHWIEQGREPAKKKRIAMTLFDRGALLALSEALAEQDKPLEKGELSRLAERAVRESERTEKLVFEELSRYRRLLSLGVVASRMIHEVRQQVELLRRNCDTCLILLRKPGPDTAAAIRAVEAADRAAGVINRETGRLGPFIRARRKPEVLDLSVLVSEVFGQEDRRLHDLGVATSLPPASPGSYPLLADYGEMFQVFHNLLDNSLHWLKGTGKPRIEVSISDTGGRYVVRFSDNGPGIPRANAEAVFEPFWTTKAGGSGLGLPIAGEILSDYGGDLALEKRFPARAGCTFRITIPARSKGKRRADG